MNVDNYNDHITEETYKTIIHNVPHTDDNKAFFEEMNSSNIHINLSEIWMDYDKIPESVHDCKFVNNIFSVNNIDIIEYKEHVKLVRQEGSRGNFYSADIKDALLKTNYKYQIKDATGEIIPFGLNRWHIDPYAGYVSFTEGYPEGYTEPFFIDYYKYIGRKASTEMLLKDGSIPMNPEYLPKLDQDIATKYYIDNSINEIKKVYDKLIPVKPESFENKDLMIIGDSFDAYDVKTNDYFEKVFINNQTVKIVLPLSYNPEAGIIRLRRVTASNDTIISVISCKKPVSNDIISVDFNGDYYTDTIISKDFYKGIKLSVTLNNLKTEILNALSNNRLTYYFEYFNEETNETYKSNYATFGVDSELVENSFFGKISVANDKSSETYISGVPTIGINDSFFIKSLKTNTLNYFKTNKKIYDINIFNDVIERLPEDNYKDYNPTITLDDKVVVPENIGLDKVTITVNSYNVYNENNGTVSDDFYIHIDTISDESNRVSSDNYKKEFKPRESLLNNNELQMEFGSYKWPQKNYQKNGDTYYNNFSNEFITKGPDYSIVPKTGERFVTLQYDLDYSNGIWIEILNPKNMTQNKLTKAFDFSTMKIKVEDFNYSTGWLNALKPYDGIGINKDDDQGCLVVQKCTENKIYCTFGPKPIKGKLYIKCGLKYNNKEFDGFNILKNI